MKEAEGNGSSSKEQIIFKEEEEGKEKEEIAHQDIKKLAQDAQIISDDMIKEKEDGQIVTDDNVIQLSSIEELAEDSQIISDDISEEQEDEQIVRYMTLTIIQSSSIEELAEDAQNVSDDTGYKEQENEQILTDDNIIQPSPIEELAEDVQITSNEMGEAQQIVQIVTDNNIIQPSSSPLQISAQDFDNKLQKEDKDRTKVYTKKTKLRIPGPPRLMTSERYGERSYSCSSKKKSSISQYKQLRYAATDDNRLHSRAKHRTTRSLSPPRLALMDKYGERKYSNFYKEKSGREVLPRKKSIDLDSLSPPRLALTQKYGDRNYSGFYKRRGNLQVHPPERRDMRGDSQEHPRRRRDISSLRPPRLLLLEKYGERGYSTFAEVRAQKEDEPARWLYCLSMEDEKVEYAQNWKERHLTTPLSPRLKTMEKLGNRRYSSASRGVGKSYSLIESKDKYIRGGFRNVSLTHRRRVKKVTVPVPFNLSRPSCRPQSGKNSETNRQQFRARPVPDFTYTPPDFRARYGKMGTTSIPFHLQSKLRRTRSHSPSVRYNDHFKAKPMPNYGRPRTTRTNRSFDRQPTLIHHFKARPMPNFAYRRSLSPSMLRRGREPTRTDPFHLYIDERGVRNWKDQSYNDDNEYEYLYPEEYGFSYDALDQNHQEIMSADIETHDIVNDDDEEWKVPDAIPNDQLHKLQATSFEDFLVGEEGYEMLDPPFHEVGSKEELETKTSLEHAAGNTNDAIKLETSFHEVESKEELETKTSLEYAAGNTNDNIKLEASFQKVESREELGAKSSFERANGDTNDADILEPSLYEVESREELETMSSFERAARNSNDTELQVVKTTSLEGSIAEEEINQVESREDNIARININSSQSIGEDSTILNLNEKESMQSVEELLLSAEELLELRPRGDGDDFLASSMTNLFRGGWYAPKSI